MKVGNQLIFALLLLFIGCNSAGNQAASGRLDTTKSNNPFYSNADSTPVELSNAEWNNILPKEVYAIAREKGTERAFSGKYNNHKDTGTYYCAVCGNPLFSSNGKFESSCGWPSFFEPIKKGSMEYAPDTTHGMKRTEVTCGRCKSHLGHVFEDGPPPTGLRYCINSVVLNFNQASASEKEFQK